MNIKKYVSNLLFYPIIDFRIEREGLKLKMKWACQFNNTQYGVAVDGVRLVMKVNSY